METRQKWSIGIFLVGLTAFFYFGAEMLMKHTAWADFQTPAGMGEIFGLGASVTATIAGALGIDIFGLVSKFNKDK